MYLDFSSTNNLYFRFNENIFSLDNDNIKIIREIIKNIRMPIYLLNKLFKSILHNFATYNMNDNSLTILIYILSYYNDLNSYFLRIRMLLELDYFNSNYNIDILTKLIYMMDYYKLYNILNNNYIFDIIYTHTKRNFVEVKYDLRNFSNIFIKKLFEFSKKKNDNFMEILINFYKNDNEGLELLINLSKTDNIIMEKLIMISKTDDNLNQRLKIVGLKDDEFKEKFITLMMNQWNH